MNAQEYMEKIIAEAMCDDGFRAAWEALSEEERGLAVEYYIKVFEGMIKLGKEIVF